MSLSKLFRAFFESHHRNLDMATCGSKYLLRSSRFVHHETFLCLVMN